MAYVPPALRKRAQGSAADGTLGTTTEAAGAHENLPPDFTPKSITGPTFHLADIHDHYWDPQSEGNGSCTRTHGTLNSSAHDPEKLKYIVLFHDANPRWQSHGIIFAKTNLYILPGGKRFREDPLSMGGATRPEPWGKSEHEMRDNTHDGETLAEEADALVNRNPSQVSLVKENQASEKSRVSEEQNFESYRQEPDEKERLSVETEKKRGASTKSDEHVGASTNDQGHQPRIEDNRKPAPDPNPETPYSPDLSLYDTGPIAVFEQQGGRGQSGGFRFAGYHRIASLEYLAPHSRELLRLLEQKFTLTDRRGRVRQKQRSEESWKSSLRHRWAVIQMEKDQEANDGLPPPKIEVRDKSVGDADGSSPKKSVNELLREMRLKD